jgi:hypothetical protein
MRPIHFLRQFFYWLRYRNAAFVNTRDELTAAMQSMPPRIVVQGDEALRAYAATLAEPDAERLARLAATTPAPSPGAPPVYMVVPTVGRIRDGYRSTRKPAPKRGRLRLQGGMDSVVVAVVGFVAALLMEWLSFPDDAPRMMRGPHRPDSPVAAQTWHLSHVLVAIAIPLLGAVALGAAAWLLWQALGLGLPVRTAWRLEQRVQGRLVMARVRKRERSATGY